MFSKAINSDPLLMFFNLIYHTVLWNVHDKCENYAILKAVHSNTILDLAYSSDGDKIFSCSADKTIILWDTETGGRIRKLKAHSSIVNAIGTTNADCNLLTSVGDDRQINIWDVRKRNYVQCFRDTYQLTSVTFNKNGDQVISGGIENIIKVWDIRKNELAYPMPCHSDTVTGLSLSPDGRSIVSNSIDNTIRIWDVRPLAPRGRLLATLTGHQHNFEKNLLRCSWSPDGNFVTGGSADRMVYIWNVVKRQVVYRLPGHRGSVNEVIFHPFEPIVLSCSSDKQLYMGELVLSND